MIPRYICNLPRGARNLAVIGGAQSTRGAGLTGMFRAGRVVVQSWSRVAEDLVRSGPAASLQWDGVALTTHFQPIHGSRRGECAGYEARARATDASGRAVSTGQLFVEAARRDRPVILDRACRALHLRNFATVDPGDGRLFLNVHPEAAVADAGSAHEFADLIGYYGLAPKRVCLEIQEPGCADERALVEAVSQYRELGAAIAVDHFGTGHSNLDRIALLRPRLVKLERSVIAAAVGEAKARSQLSRVIDLLRDAGAQVVVQGVESARDALLALDAGASFLQGNYLASPRAGIGQDALRMEVLRRLLGMRAGAVAVGED